MESAQKSFERYGRDPAHKANALDSQGEASFLNGRFAEAEKYFLEAHAKSSAMLGGGDLLKAAYARWLQGDLAGADQLFSRYLTFRNQQKDPLTVWRQAVWEYSTGRQAAAIARLSNVSPGRLRISRVRSSRCGRILPSFPRIRRRSSRPMTGLHRLRTASRAFFTPRLWRKPVKRTRPGS